MKKTILTIIFLIATFSLAHAQTDWIDYKFDDKLSVKFPSEPTTIDNDVMAIGKDSLICFISIVGETDSASLAKLTLTPNFTDELKKAIIDAQKDLTLGDIKTDKWHGYNRYDVDGIETSKKLKVSIRFLIIGGRVYAFGAMVPDNHDLNQKNLFFDTLKLN